MEGEKEEKINLLRILASYHLLSEQCRANPWTMIILKSSTPSLSLSSSLFLLFVMAPEEEHEHLFCTLYTMMFTSSSLWGYTFTEKPYASEEGDPQLRICCKCK